MTIRQLQYFVKIYECGNLLKAAETLYISHQALGRSLNILEKEIGMPLFYRSQRGVTPTALGHELYRSSSAVLRDMSVLEEHIHEYVRLSSGLLRVGLAAGVRYFNVRSLWCGFQEAYPNITIQAQEYPYTTGLDMLKNNQLDVITFSDCDPDDEYVQFPIRSWSRVLLLPEDHPLTAKEYVEPGDLKGLHIVLCANPMAYHRILSYFESHDCQPAEIILVSDTLYMYEICQREGLPGITIQGYLTDVSLPQFPRLRLMPFKEDLFPYTISVIARRDHPMGAIIEELAVYLRNFLDQDNSVAEGER